MSLDVLKLIPVDPCFVPDLDARDRALAALQTKLPAGSECEALVHDRIEFIDQGENLEAIICPLCARRLPFYGEDASAATQAWWHDTMTSLENTTADQIKITMPCCSRQTPLTALRFDWPAGFARFELSIDDPGIGEILSPSDLAEFEEILGCKLVQVRAHY